MRVLITGGAGFIGSHTCKVLASAGHEPITYDNLATGHRSAVRWGPLVVGDIRDSDALAQAFSLYQPEAIIHFAACAYVGESVVDPGKYYDNNVRGSISLIETARLNGIRSIVFSSSCAIYGVATELPLRETSPAAPINPYGWSKLMVEQILKDEAQAYDLRYVALRYFNASGADPDGELREMHDPETHLLPRALMAAAGTIPHLDVFGDDYDTPDGTCVRDFIHVMDLARAHVAALEYLAQGGLSLIANLGTGRGYSIREIVATVEQVTGLPVRLKMVPRRAGDPPTLFADPSFAQRELGFVAEYTNLLDIVRTAAPSFT